MKPVKVFISYAHEDEAFKVKLEKHLSMLKRRGMLDTWNDRELNVGDEWDVEIKAALHEADIVLFLLSADALASDYIHDVEIKKALENYKQNKTTIIPVLLRPCSFRDSPLSHFKSLPEKRESIQEYPNQDDAFMEIYNHLRQLAIQIEHAKQAHKTPKSKGEYDKISCNRKTIVRQFKFAYEKYKADGITAPFFFLEGQQYGQADSLVKRLVMELMKQEEGIKALRNNHFSEPVRIHELEKFEDAKQGFLYAFQELCGGKCTVNSLGELQAQMNKLPNMKPYAILPFPVQLYISADCWNSYLPEMIQWKLQEFSHLEANADYTFLFFIIVTLIEKQPKKNWLSKWIPHKAPDLNFNLFDTLENFLADQSGVTLLPPLKLVDRQDIDDWYSRFESNQRRREEQVDALIRNLPKPKKDKWTMSDVEIELQRVIEEMQNDARGI